MSDILRTSLAPPSQKKPEEEGEPRPFSRTSNYGKQLSNPRAVSLLKPTIRVEQQRDQEQAQRQAVQRSRAAQQAKESEASQKAHQEAMAEAQELARKRQVDAFDRYAKRIGRPYRKSYDGTPEWIDSDDDWNRQRQSKFDEALDKKRTTRRTEADRKKRETESFYSDRIGRLEDKRDQFDTLPDYKRTEYESNADKAKREMLESATYAERAKLEEQAAETDGVYGFREPTAAAKEAQARLARIDSGEESFDDTLIDAYAQDDMVIDPDQYAEWSAQRDQLASDSDSRKKRDAIQAQIDRVQQEYNPDPSPSRLDAQIAEIEGKKTEVAEASELIKAEQALATERKQAQLAKIEEDYRTALAGGVTGDQLSQLNAWRTNAAFEIQADHLEALEVLEDKFQDIALDQEDLERQVEIYNRDRKLLEAQSTPDPEERDAAMGEAAQAQKKTELLGEPTYKGEVDPEARVPKEEVQGRLEEIQATNDAIQEKALEAITPIRQDTREGKQTAEEADARIQEAIVQVAKDTETESEKAMGIVSEAINDYNAGLISDIDLNRITNAAQIPVEGVKIAEESARKQTQFETAYAEIATLNEGKKELDLWVGTWTTTQDGLPQWRKDFVFDPGFGDEFLPGIATDQVGDAIKSYRVYRQNPFDVGFGPGEEATSEDAWFPRLEDGELKYPKRWLAEAEKKNQEFYDAMTAWKMREQEALDKYPDLSDEEREFILDKAHLDGAIRQIRDAGDVWQRLIENPERVVPYAAGMAELAELLPIYDTAIRIQEAEEQGIPVEEAATQQELQRLDAFANEMSREYTNAGTITHLVEQAIPFAAEFASSGGVYTAGRKFATGTAGRAMKKYIERRAVRKIKNSSAKKAMAWRAAYSTSRAARWGGTRLAGTALMTPAAMPTRIPGMILQEDMPNIELAEDELGDLKVIAMTDNFTFGESVVRGLGRAWIETISERTGGYFRLPKRWQKALETKGWFQAAKKINGNLTNRQIVDMMKKAGFHGGFQEYLEEEVANVMSTVIMGDEFHVPSLVDVATQVAGFSIFGAGLNATSQAILEAKLQPAKREVARQAKRSDLLRRASDNPKAAMQAMERAGLTAPDGSKIQVTPDGVRLVGDMQSSPTIANMASQVERIDEAIEVAKKNNNDQATQSLLETKGKVLAKMNEVQATYLAYGSKAAHELNNAAAEAEAAGDVLAIDSVYRARAVTKILAGRPLDSLEPAERDALDQGTVIAFTPETEEAPAEPIVKPAYEMVGSTPVITEEALAELEGVSPHGRAMATWSPEEARRHAQEANAEQPDLPGTETPAATPDSTETPSPEGEGEAPAPTSETGSNPQEETPPGADPGSTDENAQRERSREGIDPKRDLTREDQERRTELTKFFESKGYDANVAEQMADQEVRNMGVTGQDYLEQGYQALDHLEKTNPDAAVAADKAKEAKKTEEPTEEKPAEKPAEKPEGGKKAKEKAPPKKKKAEAKKKKPSQVDQVRSAVDKASKEFKGILESLGLSVQVYDSQDQWTQSNDRLVDFGAIFSHARGEVGVSIPGILGVAKNMGLEGKALEDYVKATIEEEIIHSATITAIDNMAQEKGTSERQILDDIEAEFRQENPELAELIEKRIYPDLSNARAAMKRLAKKKADSKTPEEDAKIQAEIDQFGYEIAFRFVHEATRILIQYRMGASGITEAHWREGGEKYHEEIARILGDRDPNIGSTLGEFLTRLIEAIRGMLAKSKPLSESSTGQRLEEVITVATDILEGAQAKTEAEAASTAAEEENQAPAESRLMAKPVQAERSKVTGDKIVMVDTDLVDEKWSKEKGFYLSPDNKENRIKDRYEKFGEFFFTSPEYNVPEIYIDGAGNVGFTNGRHTFAWLRDHGVKRMPVALEGEAIDNARRHGMLAENPEQITQLKLEDLTLPEQAQAQAPKKEGPENSKFSWEDVEALRRLARSETDTNPTEEQKKAGNYKKGRFPWRGLNAVIENPKGSTRSGKSKKGVAWSVTMPADYGDIALTEGNDGDKIDVTIGENLASEKVFIINQKHRNHKFDEHKIYIGFDSLEQAEATYNGMFENGAVPHHDTQAATIEGLKTWLESGDHKKPYEDPNAPEIPKGAKVYGPGLADLKAEGKYKNWTEGHVPFRDFRSKKDPVYLEDGSMFFFRAGKIWFRPNKRSQWRTLTAETDIASIRKIATLRNSKFNTDTGRMNKAKFESKVGDIIDNLAGIGKIMGVTAAKKRQGGEYWEANKSEYDGYPEGGFPGIYGQMIISSTGLAPDEVATSLGMTVNEMWTELEAAVAARMKGQTGNNPEEEAEDYYEAQEKEYLERVANFEADTAPGEGRQPVTIQAGWNLGTTLQLDRGTLEIVAFDEMTQAYVTEQIVDPLETGPYEHAYGTDSVLEVGKTYHVKGIQDNPDVDPFASVTPDLRASVQNSSLNLQVPKGLGARQVRKELIAAHNMSEEGLRFIRTQQSRLAWPSLAIVPAYHGFSAYGPITLLAKPDLINPKNKNSHVFPADAWTPVAPRPQFRFNRQAAEKHEQRTWLPTREYLDRKLLPEQSKRNVYGIDVGPESVSDGSSNRFEDGRAAFTGVMASSLRMRIAFLLEQGIKVSKPMKKDSFKYDGYLDSIGQETLDKIKASRETITKLYNQSPYDQWTDEETLEIGELYKEMIDDYWGVIADRVEDRDFLEIAEKEKGAVSERFGRPYFNFHQRDDFLKTIFHHLHGAPRVIDLNEMTQRVEDKFKSKRLELAFNTWLDDMAVDIMRDPYYEVGESKRKVPATFENLLRYFKSRPVKSDPAQLGYNISTSGLRSHMIQGFTSIQEIRDNRARIVTEKQFGEWRDAMGQEFFEIVGALDNPVYQDKNQMFVDAIADYFTKFGGKGRPKLYKALEEAGFSQYRNEANIERIEQWIDLMVKGPTTYFEAKIARAVGLSEFAVAVVPKDTDPILKKWLRKSGLKVRVYTRGDFNERDARTLETARANNVLFASTRENSQVPAAIRRHGPKPYSPLPVQRLLSSTRGNQDDLISRDPRGADMIYFRSGTNSMKRLDEMKPSNAHIGSSLADFREEFYEEIPNYLNESAAAAMIDSGAVQVFQANRKGKDAKLDVPAVLESYRRLADALTPDARRRLFVTAPDAIGDAELTNQYQEEFKDEILELIEMGVQVIIPVQDQAKNLTESWSEISARVNHRPFVLGIPSTHEAFDIERVFTELDPDLLGPNGPRVSLHFLGLGINNRRTKKLIDRINSLEADHPLRLAKIRLDSNWRRSKVGEGRAITVANMTELEYAAWMAVTDEGEFDETEWWSTLREGRFPMTVEEAQAFGQVFKVPASEVREKVEIGPLAEIMEQAAYGIEDREFYLVREFLQVLARKSPRLQKNAEIVAVTQVLDAEAKRHEQQGLKLKPADSFEEDFLQVLTNEEFEEEKQRLLEQEEKAKQSKALEEKAAARLEAPDLDLTGDMFDGDLFTSTHKWDTKADKEDDGQAELFASTKPPGKLWRGEGKEGGLGTFSLGKGRYSTLDKKTAANYGDVREVDPADYWPTNPLELPGVGSAQGLVNDWIFRNTDFRNIREFNKAYPDPAKFFIERGYDGIIAGDEIVKFIGQDLKASTLPTWNAKDGYGEHDWTKEQWPEEMRLSRMPQRRRGFLGFVQGSKIRGAWFSDANVIDHSDVGGENANIDHKFRFFPYHNGGIVAWNTDPDPDALAEVEGWLLENKFPYRKHNGTWNDIPLQASTRPGKVTSDFAQARITKLHDDLVGEKWEPTIDDIQGRIRDWERIKAAADKAGEPRSPLPEEVDGEALTWSGRSLPWGLKDADRYIIAAFETGDLTGSPVDLEAQMSLADAIHYAEILKAGQFSNLSHVLERDVADELEVVRTHALQKRIREILDEFPGEFPATRVAMMEVSGDLASGGKLDEKGWRIEDVLEGLPAKRSMAALKTADYPSRSSLTSKKAIAEAVRRLYLQERPALQKLLDRTPEPQADPENYEQMDLLASTYYHGTFDDNIDGEFSGLGLHVGTQGSAQERAGGKYADDLLKGDEFSIHQEDGKFYVLDRDGFYLQSNGIEADTIERAAVFQTRESAEVHRRDLVWNQVNDFLDTGTDFGWQINEIDVEIENPFRTPDLGEWLPEQLLGVMARQGVIEDAKKALAMLDKKFPPIDGKWDLANQHDWIRRKLERAGYDGIVYRNDIEDKGRDSFIVFRRKQAQRIEPTDLYASTRPSKAPTKIQAIMDAKPAIQASVLPFNGQITKDFLEKTFINRPNEFWGIRHNGEQWVFGREGRGISALQCTGYTCAIFSKLPPGRVEWFGFYIEDNPTATGMARLADGHDFAVIDGRWIVDPWLTDIEAVSTRGVFDLEAGPDRAQVKKWYGKRSKWKNMTGQIAPAPGPPAEIQPTPAMTTNPGFRKFFGPWDTNPDQASKVLDSAGRPLVAFRGDNRIDVINKAGGFEAQGVDYGGGSGALYFTNAPFVASGYAEGKEHFPYDEVEAYYGVRRAVDDTYWSLEDLAPVLTTKELAKLDAIIPVLASERWNETEEYMEAGPFIEPENSNIPASHWEETKRRNRNTWEAAKDVLIQSGLYSNQEFGKILELAGIVSESYYQENLSKPALSMMFLNIRSPFRTDNQEDYEKVKAYIKAEGLEPLTYKFAEGEENTKEPWVDVSPEEWRLLEGAGYDGIIDAYGGNIMEGGSHTVYLVRDAKQIRPAFSKPHLMASFSREDVAIGGATLEDANYFNSPWVQSKAYQTIQDKMPVKGMMPGKQILGMLTKNGVRKEEIEDLQIDVFLKRGGIRFSRRQVLGFIETSMPVIVAKPPVPTNEDDAGLDWSTENYEEVSEYDVDERVRQRINEAWQEDEFLDELESWWLNNSKDLDGYVEWSMEQNEYEDESDVTYDDVGRWLKEEQIHDQNEYEEFLQDEGYIESFQEAAQEELADEAPRYYTESNFGYEFRETHQGSDTWELKDPNGHVIEEFSDEDEAKQRAILHAVEQGHITGGSEYSEYVNFGQRESYDEVVFEFRRGTQDIRDVARELYPEDLERYLADVNKEADALDAEADKIRKMIAKLQEKAFSLREDKDKDAPDKITTLLERTDVLAKEETVLIREAQMKRITKTELEDYLAPHQVAMVKRVAQRNTSYRNQEFKETHWQNPDAVFHIRFDTRTHDAGNEVEKWMVIQEVQSDMHTEGRQSAYIQPEEAKRLSAIQSHYAKQVYDWFESRLEEGQSLPTFRGGIPGSIRESLDIKAAEGATDLPVHAIQRYDKISERLDKITGARKLTPLDFPWKQTWPEKVMWWSMKLAASRGYTGVTWASGADQINLYSEKMRQNVKKIDVTVPERFTGMEGVDKEISRRKREFDYKRVGHELFQYYGPLMQEATKQTIQDFNYQKAYSEGGLANPGMLTDEVMEKFAPNMPVLSSSLPKFDDKAWQESALELFDKIVWDQKGLTSTREDSAKLYEIFFREMIANRIHDAGWDHWKKLHGDKKPEVLDRTWGWLNLSPKEFQKAIGNQALWVNNARRVNSLPEASPARNFAFTHPQFAIVNNYKPLTDYLERAKALIQRAEDGRRWAQVAALGPDGRNVFDEFIPLTGTTEISGRTANLERVVGSRLANDIREKGNATPDNEAWQHTYEGDDLSIGGHLHRMIYDTILPRTAAKLAKKFKFGKPEGVPISDLDLEHDAEMDAREKALAHPDTRIITLKEADILWKGRHSEGHPGLHLATTRLFRSKDGVETDEHVTWPSGARINPYTRAINLISNTDLLMDRGMLHKGDEDIDTLRHIELEGTLGTRNLPESPIYGHKIEGNTLTIYKRPRIHPKHVDYTLDFMLSKADSLDMKGANTRETVRQNVRDTFMEERGRDFRFIHGFEQIVDDRIVSKAESLYGKRVVDEFIIENHGREALTEIEDPGEDTHTTVATIDIANPQSISRWMTGRIGREFNYQFGLAPRDLFSKQIQGVRFDEASREKIREGVMPLYASTASTSKFTANPLSWWRAVEELGNKGAVGAAKGVAAVARFGSRKTGVTALVRHLSGTSAGEWTKGASRWLQGQIAPATVLPREAAALINEARTSIVLSNEIGMDLAKILEGGGDHRLMDFHVNPRLNTPDNHKTLSLYFRGKIPASRITDPELRDLADKIKGLWDARGLDLVRAGLMSQETYDERRSSYYPHMFYEKEQEKYGIKSISKKLKMGLDRVRPQLSTAWYIYEIDPKNHKPKLDAKGNIRLLNHARGKWRFDSPQHRDQWFESYVNQEVVKELHEAGRTTFNLRDLARLEQMTGDVQALVAAAKMRIGSQFAKGKPKTEDELEKMGLIENMAYVVPRSIIQMDVDIHLAKLFTAIASKPEWVSDNPISDYSPIPEDPRYGELSGKYVNKEIAREIEGFIETPILIADLYDGGLRLWKKWKTVYNPGTHFRNVLGNTMFCDLADCNWMNPENWKYYWAIKRTIQNKNSDVPLEELFKEGILGGDFSRAELEEIANELPGPPSGNENSDIKPFIFREPGRWAKRMVKMGDTGVTKLYRLEDELFKVATYLAARDRGLTREEAGEHVRTWFPFYDRIGESGLLKFVRRFNMPFLSFMHEAWRIGFRAMRQKPVTFAKWMAVPSLITYYSAYVLGLDDDDLEGITKDMRGKIGDWPFFSMLLPWTDSQGRPAQWDLSNVIPYADALGKRIDRGDKAPPWYQEMIQKYALGGPLTQLALAWGMGIDPFSGRKFKQTGMSETEVAAEQFRYSAALILPPWTPFFGTSDPLRVFMDEFRIGTMKFGSPESRGQFLTKRNRRQEAIRSYLGLDIRTASPNPWRMVEDYRKEYMLPPRPEFNDSTAESRARRALYTAIVNDNLEEITANLVELRDDVREPVATRQDVERLLFHRNPLHALPRDHQRRFLASLSSIERETIQKAVAEFRKVEQKAWRLIQRAKTQMPPPAPRSRLNLKPVR